MEVDHHAAESERIEDDVRRPSLFRRPKKKKPRLTGPQRAELVRIGREPRHYVGSSTVRLHNVLIAKGFARLIVGKYGLDHADITDEGRREIGLPVKVEVTTVPDPCPSFIPIDELRDAYEAIVAEEDDPMHDDAFLRWLELTRQWVPRLLDEVERFRTAASLPVSDAVAGKLEAIRSEVEAFYQDRVASLEAALTAVRAHNASPDRLIAPEGKPVVQGRPATFHGMLADMADHELAVWYGIFGSVLVTPTTAYNVSVATIRANETIEQLRCLKS